MAVHVVRAAERRVAVTLIAWLVANTVLAESRVDVSPASAAARTDPTTLTFPITRGPDTSFDAFLDYHAESGTAVTGTDFTAPTGPLLLPRGATLASLTFNIAGSVSGSADKNFQLHLDSVLGVGPAPSFFLAQTVSMGTNPLDVRYADINLDGKPDLVTSAHDADEITVRLNTTSPGASVPTFSPRYTFATGDGPRSLDSADLNGDGRVDLIVTNSAVLANSISILVNDTVPGASSPSFVVQQGFAVQTMPLDVKAEDLNGDGKLDLVVSPDGATMSLLLNTTTTGSSTLSFGSEQYLSMGNFSYSVATPDINFDGLADLLIANYNDHTLTTRINITSPGDTVFSFAPVTTTTLGSNPTFIDAADFNADGKPDVIVSDEESDTVSVLLNTTLPGATAATFSTRQTLSAGDFPAGILAVDLNQDGRAEVIATNAISNQLAVWRNITKPGASSVLFAPKQSYDVGASPYAIDADDINGDGWQDLVVANHMDSSVSVLMGSNTSTASHPAFSTQQTFATGQYPEEVKRADINRDGKPDAVVPNLGANTVSVLLNTTVAGAVSASFAAALDIPAASPRALAIADFNGDGLEDIAVAKDASNVGVSINNTATGSMAASFYALADFTVATGAPTAQPTSITAADLNGDGKPDIIANDEHEDVIAVLMNTTSPGASAASFTASQEFATGNYPVFVAVADVNRDGKPDLLVANELDNSFSILLNTTIAGTLTASFAAPQTFAVAGVDSHPMMLDVVDLNGDGNPEIISTVSDVTTSEGHILAIFRNTTPAGAMAVSLAAQQDITAGIATYAYSILSTDMNGDGKPDLISADFPNDNLLVHINTTETGATSFSFLPKQTLAVGRNPRRPISADFNGDGLLDLIVANSLDGTASVYLNERLRVDLSATATTGTIHLDSTPATFAFAALTGVPVNSEQISDAISVSGITRSSPISIAGGSYSINGGAYVTSGGTVSNGDQVSVRLTSSASFLTEALTTLNIGGVTGTFSVTTEAEDAVPDAFSFSALAGVPVNSVQTSNAVTITGINTAAPISVGDGGSYSINGGAYTTSTGTVLNGDQVTVRLTSAANFVADATVTLTIGNISGSFTVTTEVEDAVPDAFSLAALSGVAMNSDQTSNALTVTGINTTVPISISGGSYSINGGEFTTSAGTVKANDVVRVRVTSSGNPSTTSTATLTIAGVNANFSVTTAAATGGGGGGGGETSPALLSLLALLACLHGRKRNRRFR
ncbi:MAG: FG-GAP-like repeat-containing protein [Pseudomonadota bacterium]